MIVKSLVSDLLMPPISLIFADNAFADRFLVLRDGDMSGPYSTLAAAKEAGAVTMNYGTFLDGLIAFLIVGFWLFLLLRYIKKLQGLWAEEVFIADPTTKRCPFCMSEVKLEATRCAFCTSQLTLETA